MKTMGSIGKLRCLKKEKIMTCAKWRTSLILAFMFSVVFPLCVLHAAEDNFTELENEVRNLLGSNDIVNISRNLQKVYDLAQLYESKGDLKGAIDLYEAGLRAGAQDFEKQLILTKLYLKTGRKQRATEKAKDIFNLAEDEGLISEAHRILRSENVSLVSRKNTKVGLLNTKVEIVLVPVGEVNQRYIEELRDKLEAGLKVSFLIGTQSVHLKKWDRSHAVVYVNDIIKMMKTDSKFPNLLKALGFPETTADSYEGQLKIIRGSFDLQKKEAIDERIKTAIEKGAGTFEMNLSKLQATGQYDTDTLLTTIKKELKPGEVPASRGYLGVTAEDLFSGTSTARFYFGSALTGGKIGVISYYRFLALNNQETQNRPRLLSRLYKQAISSVFFMFGIPRCTSLSCVRTFPKGLVEHDEKPEELCESCKKNWGALLKKITN